MDIVSQLNTTLENFAIRIAEEFNNRIGPWKIIPIAGIQVYLVKGQGNIQTAILEQNDKIVYSNNLGQIIVSTYLDANADKDDINNPLIWDQNSIG